MPRPLRRVIVSLLIAAAVAGCMAPRASVMPMQDIPVEQQERDRRDCEAHAGYADVSKPVSHAVIGTLAGAVAGLGVAAMLAFSGNVSTDDRNVGLYFLAAAAGGVGIGALVGTAYGYRLGVAAAHEEYFARYVECMRVRGYSVIRER